MEAGAEAKTEKRPTVAILQSCYIPWKGYFDIIGLCDIFVIYDDVQYSKNHWHNRNQIKTQHGLKWLTIPVSKAEGAFQPIDHVRIPEPFAKKHWSSIAQAYAKAPHFRAYAPRIEALYERAAALERLTDVNVLFLTAIADMLGLSTQFVQSATLQSGGVRTERLIGICAELGAGAYLSGPSAKSYIEEDKFAEAGITLRWMDYGGYPAYPQLHGPFEHATTILDLLFNLGSDARGAMKCGAGPS